MSSSTITQLSASPKFVAYIAALPEGSNHLEIARKCDTTMAELMRRLGMEENESGPIFETRVVDKSIMMVYSPEYEMKFASMDAYKRFLERVYSFAIPQDSEATLPNVTDLKFKYGMNPNYKIGPETSLRFREHMLYLEEQYNQLLSLYAKGMKWHLEKSKPEVTLKYHWLFRFYCSPILRIFDILETSIMTGHNLEEKHKEYHGQRAAYLDLEANEMQRLGSIMSSLTCLCCPLILVGSMLVAATQCCWVPFTLKKAGGKKVPTDLEKICW